MSSHLYANLSAYVLLEVEPWPNPFLFILFLSDQAMFLYFSNKSAKNSHFSVLGNTFRGLKHGCKHFGIPEAHSPHYSPTIYGLLPLYPVWLWSPSQILYRISTRILFCDIDGLFTPLNFFLLCLTGVCHT